METEHFDMIVIGGGSAGYAAARTAREQWENVVIIDDAPELGGLCILRGCMPSKTLIYSAEILHQAKRGALFGLEIPAASADMRAVKERKLRTIDEFQSYRVDQLESGRFTLIRERARFVSPELIELKPSGRRLTAKAFLVATGSVVNQPNVPGIDHPKIWTSDDVLELDFLPRSLIMLGGGIVACELAQYLARMGTRVIQIQRSPRILLGVSDEAANVVMRVFEEEAVELYTDTHLQGIEQTAEGFSVRFLHQGNPVTVTADHVCNALGRRPNLRGLNIEAAGVQCQRKGQIEVDSMQRTANPRIYAAGDVAGPFEIVHLAVMQGEIAARHACGGKPDPINYEALTTVVFTDPQIGFAGLTPQEALAVGCDVVTAEYPFDDHGKSILMEAKHGYVKAWADRRTGRLLGAECVGKDGGELIHQMAVAIALNAQVKDLLKVHWYHPTLSEIWSYPLEDLVEALG